MKVDAIDFLTRHVFFTTVAFSIYKLDISLQVKLLPSLNRKSRWTVGLHTGNPCDDRMSLRSRNHLLVFFV